MLSTNVKIKLNNKNQAKNIEKLNELMKNLTKLYSQSSLDSQSRKLEHLNESLKH